MANIEVLHNFKCSATVLSYRRYACIAFSPLGRLGHFCYCDFQSSSRVLSTQTVCSGVYAFYESRLWIYKMKFSSVSVQMMSKTPLTTYRNIVNLCYTRLGWIFYIKCKYLSPIGIKIQVFPQKYFQTIHAILFVRSYKVIKELT